MLHRKTPFFLCVALALVCAAVAAAPLPPLPPLRQSPSPPPTQKPPPPPKPDVDGGGAAVLDTRPGSNSDPGSAVGFLQESYEQWSWQLTERSRAAHASVVQRPLLHTFLVVACVAAAAAAFYYLIAAPLRLGSSASVLSTPLTLVILSAVIGVALVAFT